MHLYSDLCSYSHIDDNDVVAEEQTVNKLIDERVNVPNVM